jgi:UDP-N-acetylglucosamine--N-acetylmuramyl-(pentapeptide) pyrophosphoryl-undecaprenol N-acetylglucosamine transferase
VASTTALYNERRARAQVVPFIADVPSVLARAGLVVCRAGGTTLAELAVMGTPAAVCPYPHAADDHQRRNAIEFAAAGACLVVDQREAGIRRLGAVVTGLIDDAGRREQMARAMRDLARPDAARRIAELVLGTRSQKPEVRSQNAEVRGWRREHVAPRQGDEAKTKGPKPKP